MSSRHTILLALLLCCMSMRAQIGQYRSEFAVGVNGGITLSTIAFTPEIPQDMLMGKTFGLTLRYTGEKYFNSICAIVAEVNYTQMGWKESILDKNDQAVINRQTGVAEEYSRVIDYIQVPFFARLGWGRERKGFQFFFQIGPQLGYFLSEKAEYNFDLDNPNTADRIALVSRPDYSNIYHMNLENSFDYGIAAGLGLEFSHRKLGHFMVEGRYYFGLGNIYGNTKRDYFAKSNHQTIYVKAAYLFDLLRSKNPKIK